MDLNAKAVSDLILGLVALWLTFVLWRRLPLAGIGMLLLATAALLGFVRFTEMADVVVYHKTLSSFSGAATIPLLAWSFYRGSVRRIRTGPYNQIAAIAPRGSEVRQADALFALTVFIIYLAGILNGSRHFGIVAPIIGLVVLVICAVYIRGYHPSGSNEIIIGSLLFLASGLLVTGHTSELLWGSINRYVVFHYGLAIAVILLARGLVHFERLTAPGYD